MPIKVRRLHLYQPVAEGASAAALTASAVGDEGVANGLGEGLRMGTPPGPYGSPYSYPQAAMDLLSSLSCGVMSGPRRT